MKKYLYLALVAIIACITSCSNDDIEVGYSVNVKVDPSGVIKPFDFEIVTGELESILANCSLRVTILAYDTEGVLADKQDVLLTSYASLANFNMHLAPSQYTFVAITDVVYKPGTQNSRAYWILSDTDNLSTCKISRTDYIGYKAEILGVGTTKATVGTNGGSVMVNPSPAGALLLVCYFNIHAYSDITELKLQNNRVADFAIFNSNADLITTPKNNNNNFSWRTDYFNPKDYPKSNYLYSYHFTFPISNIMYRFVYSDASTTNERISENMSVNLRAGEEWDFELDLKNSDYDNKITYYFGKVNGGSSARTNGPTALDKADNTQLINICNLKSARITDLIQTNAEE